MMGKYAFHVHIYRLLYDITNQGENIRIAQYIFAVLSTLYVALVAAIYHRTQSVPQPATLLLILSKRIHSIFVLRLFNDPIAMFLFHLSLLCMIHNHWSLGCIIYSLAVGVKMNILLFAPAVGCLLMKRFDIVSVAYRIEQRFTNTHWVID